MKYFVFEKDEVGEYKAPEPNTRFARFLVDPEKIENAPLSMAVFRYERGQIGPAHTHDREVEVYYILKGEGTLRLDDEVVQLREGTVVYISPGVEHETTNTGEGEFEFLGIFAPPFDFGGLKSQWSKE